MAKFCLEFTLLNDILNDQGEFTGQSWLHSSGNSCLCFTAAARFLQHWVRVAMTQGTLCSGVNQGLFTLLFDSCATATPKHTFFMSLIL